MEQSTDINKAKVEILHYINDNAEADLRTGAQISNYMHRGRARFHGIYAYNGKRKVGETYTEGTISKALSELEDAGFIERSEQISKVVKAYKLTSKGLAAILKLKDGKEVNFEEGTHKGETPEFRKAVVAMKKALGSAPDKDALMAKLLAAVGYSAPRLREARGQERIIDMGDTGRYER
jgi:DNA-binding PadR family transcriptional regulator